MISTGWYKDMFDAFFERFEVLEKDEYPKYLRNKGAMDVLFDKNTSFTLGDMEHLFDNPTPHWPLSLTCPECKEIVDIGHLDWTHLNCISCGSTIERSLWILKGFEK